MDFKLGFDIMKRREVKSIGDNVSFLGHNQAISISSQSFGEFTRNNFDYLFIFDNHGCSG